MTRMSSLLLLAALATGPVLAPLSRARAEYSVKVSLSREDPDVRTLSREGDGMVEFFLFVDGEPAKGGEFGITIHGGELIGYILDVDNPWLTLPMENPYPGTVGQAGPNCLEPPVYFGRMLVRPDEPGGHVSLDVMPSERAEHAMILRCDLTPANGFRAYPAALNGEPAEPHRVEGIPEISGERSGAPQDSPPPPPEEEGGPGSAAGTSD